MVLNIINDFVNEFSDLIDTIKSFIENMISFITDIFSFLPSNIYSLFMTILVVITGIYIYRLVR